MTRGLEKALGLPSLADLYANNDLSVPGDPADPSDTGVDIYAEASVPAAVQNDGALPSPVGTVSHDRSMDIIYDEALKLARDVADAGFQADMARMPRYFEVANALFKTAGDMATSKHEHQLRAMKMAIELKRLEIDQQKAAGTGITATTTTAEGVFVADRNEIIAARIAARKKATENPEEN